MKHALVPEWALRTAMFGLGRLQAENETDARANMSEAERTIADIGFDAANTIAEALDQLTLDQQTPTAAAVPGVARYAPRWAWDVLDVALTHHLWYAAPEPKDIEPKYYVGDILDQALQTVCEDPSLCEDVPDPRQDPTE